ncbi:MAG: PAS domain S-box protein [Candidatus Methylomirabilis sp.]
MGVRPIKVLLIEDNPGDARLLQAALAEAGDSPFKLEFADRLSVGLNRLGEEGIGVILLDLGLPDSQGLNTLDSIRTAAPSLPIIVVTGLDDEAVAVQAIQSGAQDYLVKGHLGKGLLERAIRYATERKRAEAALRESEARKGAVLEVALDCIVSIDHKGRIIEFNPAAERTFGYTRAEVLGRELAEVVIPPALRDRHRRGLRHYLATGEASVLGTRLEMPAMRANGTEFPVELAITRLPIEGPPVFTGYIRDITERKRAEETLQALYQASLAIQEALGLQKRLNRLLETAQTVLGLDRVNILLADPEEQWLQAVASLGVDEPLEAIRVPIGPAGGALAEAYRSQQVVTWDGLGSVPPPLRLQPPYDRIEALRSKVFANVPLVVQGRPIGVLGADRKHSRRPLDAATLELLQLFAGQAALAIEHGRLYEELRMAAIQLEATVEARTRELHEAMKRAEEASRYKSEFLTNMSHELRTPLNSVLGFSELLQKRNYGSLTEKQLRFVHNIQESGRHLLALIDDLLDLSKVEAGRLELRREPVHLSETIDAALTTIRPQAEAKGLALNLAVESGLPPLLADPVRVRQILYNLLSNAVKFTPSGGSITITARRVPSSEGRVSRSEPGTRNPEPGTPQSSDFVEIAVADTGIGIKPEDLPKLFQSFTQLEAALAKGYKGSGLGLALTKRLVELHGGQIEAASKGEGQGSTFTVRLPLTPPDAP